MKKRKIAFDEMPDVLADLVLSVNELSDKVEAMNNLSRAQTESTTGRIILDTDQVCRMLRKTRTTIYRMVSRGEIPCRKRGKYLSFYEDEIIAYLEKGKRMTIDEMVGIASDYSQKMQNAV